MTRNVVIFFAVSMIILSGCNLTTVEENQQLTLPAEHLQGLELVLDKGEVSIIGEEGRTEIEVTAALVAVGESEEEAMAFQQDRLIVELTEQETTAKLTTVINRDRQATTAGEINLEVFVPSDMKIAVKQTEGFLSVQDIQQSIDINHGTGNMSLAMINGDIKITDGAGTIEMEEMKGHIDVYTNSGNFSLEQLQGNIDVIAGSGDINIKSVDGSVTIVSGTGAISVDTVQEDVTVIQNKSGEVTITNVKGEISQ